MPSPEHLGKFEMVGSFGGSEDNLHIWGKLHINRTGRTVGGWSLDSWSDGAPYWLPKFHWFDKSDGKLYHVYLEFGRAVNLHGEDTNIDAKRAKFIRKMVEKWELEWLEDEGKKP